jgi:hypothetical protein
MAAMEALKEKCKDLVNSAAVLSDKLESERRHAAGLLSGLQQKEILRSVQEARGHQLMKLLVEARSDHRQTLCMLDDVCAQLHLVCKRENKARLEAAGVLEELKGHADEVDALQHQLAACKAKAKQAEWQGLEADKRLQACLCHFFLLQ